MNADGSNERRLRVQESHPSTIAWSPDGRRLAYDGSDVPGVKTIDADGGNDRVISHTKHISQTTGVSWSPDGHSLAFGYVPDPSNRAIRRLAIVKVDGSGFRDVTLGTFDSAVRPVWSPDATILAVVANSGLRSAVEACGADIFLVDVVGKEPPRILPKFGCEAYAPSWSGDGSNIAFSAPRFGWLGFRDIRHRRANSHRAPVNCQWHRPILLRKWRAGPRARCEYAGGSSPVCVPQLRRRRPRRSAPMLHGGASSCRAIRPVPTEWRYPRRTPSMGTGSLRIHHRDTRRWCGWLFRLYLHRPGRRWARPTGGSDICLRVGDHWWGRRILLRRFSVRLANLPVSPTLRRRHLGGVAGSA